MKGLQKLVSIWASCIRREVKFINDSANVTGGGGQPWVSERTVIQVQRLFQSNKGSGEWKACVNVLLLSPCVYALDIAHGKKTLA